MLLKVAVDKESKGFSHASTRETSRQVSSLRRISLLNRKTQ